MFLEVSKRLLLLLYCLVVASVTGVIGVVLVVVDVALDFCLNAHTVMNIPGAGYQTSKHSQALRCRRIVTSTQPDGYTTSTGVTHSQLGQAIG